MTCFYPQNAYRLDSGKVVFTEKGGGREFTLPCGQCIGCRLAHSREWAIRCVHEASLHEDNCFITLTYNPENLPPDGGLIKKDFKDFMKRLRKKFVRYATDENGKGYAVNPIRYFHCGEYGEKNLRPHYHAILFNFNFEDWTYLYDSPGGSEIYTSPTLEKIWGLGFVTVGTVTFESAAYVARYCLKKVNGKLKDQIDEKTDLKHYERINSFTGEIHEVSPEYSTMSRNKGIGHNWISQFTTDCYPKDFTTIRGAKVRPPKYYDKYLQSIDPDMYDDIVSGRELSYHQTDRSNEPSLSDQEKVKSAQHKQLKRSL